MLIGAVAPLLLLTLLLIFVSCALSSKSRHNKVTEPAENAIVVENRLQGTRKWWSPQGPKGPAMLGFATNFSYYPRETVEFKISTVMTLKVLKVQIYRLGYYSGDGGRFVGEVKTLQSLIITQEPCNFEHQSRMTDCANWKVTVRWKIPGNATTGVYVALPVSPQYGIGNGHTYELLGSYIPFVVLQSPKARKSDLLFKTADTTYVAYNQYGGWNLYRGNGSFAFSSRATKASYNRPWANRLPAPRGAFSNFIFGAEYSMIYWLEKHGYDVSYVGCAALELMDRENLLVPSNFKALLSVGHDEYWTQAIKSAHYRARENGVHLAFFSGNEGYWRVLWDNGVVKSADSGSSSTTGFKKHSGHSHGHHSYHNNINESVVRADRSGGLYRVLHCAKESIDNIPAVLPRESVDRTMLRGRAERDGDGWTGTFIDPRHRKK